MGIYKSFEEAKNGTKIPVFLSGRTMESRYNPQRDAEKLLESISEDNKFFLVLGIGSGIFLELLSDKFPAARIIAFELYEEDLDFLFQNENLLKLKQNPLISFSTLSSIESTLSQNYLPARDGNLKIIEQHAWVNENQTLIPEINKTLQKTLGIISVDYSVQAHFGKIWNNNILSNSLLIEKHRESIYSGKFETENKTAVIIAAGPSLDKTIQFLCEPDAKEKYFIIATDTAGQVLTKWNINPDIIVSIDGQSVSYNHFIGVSNSVRKSSVFAFDICSNTSAARHIIEAGNKVLFFCSGHPLSSAINASNNNCLPQLFSGAGTVTITALDLVVQAGFDNILVLGADFAYSNGKAYASGTYLDSLYNKTSSKIAESEETFTKLMFRTELTQLSTNKKTTQILEAYRYSFEKYLSERSISFKNENDVYQLTSTVIPKKVDLSKTINNFSLNNFLKKLKSASIEESEPLLLPYIAWLRNSGKYPNLSYEELLKLALDSIVSYNI